MRNNDDFKFATIPPMINSLFDDIEHRVLSPLSCLREFYNQWVFEFYLPLVNKNVINITFDEDTINVEAKLNEKYSEKQIGDVTKFEYFKKSLSLPGKIDNKKITAQFQKGRLVIKIPKKVIGHQVKIT